MSLLAAESVLLTASATDASSNLASLGSTHPTTIADTASVRSDAASSKHDVITVADDAADAPPPGSLAVPQEPPPPRRARRARQSAPVYNLERLSSSTTNVQSKRRTAAATTAAAATDKATIASTTADDATAESRRRTISGDTLVGSIETVSNVAPSPSSATRRLLANASAASHAPSTADGISTPRSTRQRARQTRDVVSAAPAASASAISSFGSKLSVLGKRGRGAIDKGLSSMSRELRRLQDTNEYAGIEDKPVLLTVWSNGKYVDPNEPAPPARKKAKVDSPPPEPSPAKEIEAEPITNTKQRRVKKFLAMGLYAGQDAPSDPAKGLTPAERKKLAHLPELATRPRVNKTMPPLLYTGLRTLIAGRDFRLPYNVCNPLPPGQPKPDEWKRMTKNRFIGDSKDYWRKTPHLHDYQSKCVCTAEDGCGESCQNHIMLYECDATNCNVGDKHCNNRAFADLTARRAKGGKYRTGVEVIKTSDRGYGVRSNRCFQPNQIIMEYAGEIITEEECERRMNEVYKDNECYYLMSFDQNMIIDATTGSIARFVNHSCNPNCRMIKWIVSGQPRMALFAGDRPIMTGDELTYDYNFDPFSAKNVQSCLCGEVNCRGVLGPKPREVRTPKTDIGAAVKSAVKATVKAGKRKLKELMGGEVASADDEAAAGGSAKKRAKLQHGKQQPQQPQLPQLPQAQAQQKQKAASKPPSKQTNNKQAAAAAAAPLAPKTTKAKASLPRAGLAAAKGAALALKKTVSMASAGAKKAAMGSSSSAGGDGAKTSAKRPAAKLVKKSSTKKVVRRYGAANAKKVSTSRASSLTIVAMGDETGQPTTSGGVKTAKTALNKAKKASPVRVKASPAAKAKTSSPSGRAKTPPSSSSKAKTSPSGSKAKTSAKEKTSPPGKAKTPAAKSKTIPGKAKTSLGKAGASPGRQTKASPGARTSLPKKALTGKRSSIAAAAAAAAGTAKIGDRNAAEEAVQQTPHQTNIQVVS